MISAQKPGFFDAKTIPGSSENLDPLVTVGSGKNDFRVSLYPAARIVGRITDTDGEPVENISIQTFSEQIVQGRKLFQPQTGTSTDDDGFYRMDNLLPGRFVIFANGHVLPAPYWNAPPEVTRPVYYPDSRDLASAQQIEVRAGQEFRADFRLRPERGFRVLAAVQDIPAEANVGFSLENASGHGVGFWPMKFDQRKGKFVAEAVPSGTWTLSFSANDGEHSYNARQAIVVDGADVTDLQLSLHSLASIPVRVNHAVNAAQSSPDPGLANNCINASLTSIDPLHYLSYGIQMRGSPPVASFENVSAGTYKLSIHPSGNECLESAWYGSIDLSRDYLVVGSGVDAQAVTINLSSNCATLSVKLGQARTAFVLIVPNSLTAEPEIFGLAAPSMQPVGITTQLTLSPGSYQVFAFSNMDGLEYANPEAMRGYPSQTVTLDPGQKAELTLELIERKAN